MELWATDKHTSLSCHCVNVRINYNCKNFHTVNNTVPCLAKLCNSHKNFNQVYQNIGWRCVKVINTLAYCTSVNNRINYGCKKFDVNI